MWFIYDISNKTKMLINKYATLEYHHTKMNQLTTELGFYTSLSQNKYNFTIPTTLHKSHEVPIITKLYI